MDIEETITVAGAKGGVGKTTTCINIGAAAAAHGIRTVIVELDLAMANVVDFLSFERAESDPTLHEVLSGDADIRDAVYRVGENMAVAPSGTGLEGYSSVDLTRLPSVLETLQDAFDLVIVDTGAGLSEPTVKPLRLADATVLVSTPRVSSIRDVEKTKLVSERVGTPVCGLVLTKSGTGASPGPDRIAEFLDVTLLGHVPNDGVIPSSQDQGASVIEAAPDSDAAEKYRKAAGHLLFKIDLGIDQSGTDADDGGETTDSLPTADSETDPVSVVREALEETESSDVASLVATADTIVEPETADTDSETDARRSQDQMITADGQGGTRVVSRVDSAEATDTHPEYRSLHEVEMGSDQDRESSDTDAATQDRQGNSSGGDTTDDDEPNGSENGASMEKARETPDRTVDDGETEGANSAASLTGRLRSFVGNIGPGS